jgi:hypothetical protein
VWELIDAVVSRAELQAAVAAITELVPPDVDDDGVKRAQLATRIATVTGFLKTLTGVVDRRDRVRGDRRRAGGPG